MRVLAVTTVFVALAVGCTTSSSSSDEGGGSASCASRVEFDDHTYEDVANVKFTVGAEVGKTRSLTCKDADGQSESGSSPSESTAYRIDGLDTAVAIAVGDAPDAVRFYAVESGKGLPAEVEKFVNGS